MRIVYVSDLNPPKQVGGAEAVMRMEAVEAARSGHEVHVISLGPYSENLRVANALNGVENHFLGTGILDPYTNTSSASKIHTAALGIFNPVFARRMRAVIGNLRPDIVHSHYVYRISLGAVSTTVRPKIPWVHTFHDYLFECPKGSLTMRSGQVCPNHPIHCRFRNFIFMRTFGQPTRTIAISNFVKLRLIKAGFSESRIVHLPNPLKIPDNTVNVSYDGFLLYVGRLERHKGIVDFAEEFSRLPGKDYRLVIAGTGPDERYLRRLAGRTPKRIQVLGHISDEKLAELYATCSAVVFPSKWPEVMPLVPLEALSYGKPVVASSLGGTTDFVHDRKTGLVIDSSDMSAYAHASSMLLADESLAKELGRRGREAVKELSIDSHIKKLLDIYSSLLST